MHGRLLAIAVAVAPLAAYGMGGYVEGTVGYTAVSDVGIQGTATTTEAGTVSKMSLEYSSGVGTGLEIGIRDFEEYGSLRFGLAWDHFDADLDRVSYTVSGGTEVPAGRYSESADDVRASGVDFDTSANIFTANIYRDFPVSKSATLYLGGGLGVADVDHMDDTPFAWRFSLGARYYVTDSASLGLRWDYIGISEPEDELGIKYDNINTNRIGASAMVEF